MALEPKQIEELTHEFIEIRPRGGLLTPPTQRFPGFSLPDGYAIGNHLIEHLQGQGQIPVGKKIGFTNQAIWPAAGIDSPIWATLYQNTVQRTSELSLKGMAAPRIEPEIVFGLGRDLSGRNLSAEEILAAMEWYALGFEIVDCNYPGWKNTPQDAVADYGLHAALVVGLTHPVTPALANPLAEFTVKLYREDELMAEGAGKNVLGSPALAINWLLDTLQNQGINGLKAGETVTTGTLTDALVIEPGETWRFEVSGLDMPSLSLKFV